jgi:hypothetical protein
MVDLAKEKDVIPIPSHAGREVYWNPFWQVKDSSGRRMLTRFSGLCG